MEIQVKCHAGFRGEETPRKLLVAGREITVKSVQTRWQEPHARYFKVLGADGRSYRLRHDGEKWELF